MLARTLREEGHALRILDLPSCDYSYFEGWTQTQILRGNILNPSDLDRAVDGAEVVLHLAAILPPASELDRGRTFSINVEGTRHLLEACRRSGGKPRVVFSSSVSVFGDTSGEGALIAADHPVKPKDIYGESKVEAERLLIESGLPYINLRISGIAIAAFLDPPEPWPFMKEQRIELVYLPDVIRAMVQSISASEILNETFIIAGGPTWQVTGGEFVERWGKILEIPLEEMSFRDDPGWLNWYDTALSESTLGYQKTILDAYFEELKKAVKEELF
jgi:nucleoside-diphosphate-sugar epimerase